MNNTADALVFQLKNIIKKFGGLTALSEVDLNVKES